MTKIATALLLMLATLHAAGQDSKPGAGPGANVVPPPRLLGRTPVTAGALVTPGHKPAGAASMPPITAPPKGTLGTVPAAGKAPVGTPPQGGESPLGESVKAVIPSK